MKKALIIIAILLFVTPCYAASVKFQWTPITQEVDGYRLFQRVEGADYDYSKPAWSGNFVTCTIRDLEIGTRYYFVVRAYKGLSESGDSNEVSHVPPLTEKPTNLIVNALEEIIQGLKHLKDAVLASAQE